MHIASIRNSHPQPYFSRIRENRLFTGIHGQNAGSITRCLPISYLTPNGSKEILRGASVLEITSQAMGLPASEIRNSWLYLWVERLQLASMALYPTGICLLPWLGFQNTPQITISASIAYSQLWWLHWLRLLATLALGFESKTLRLH
jgi:hypothetical protein